MAEQQTLKINDLHVSIGEKAIVKGLSLEIKGGEIHALMGPNGSGKTTLSKALMGHPAYTVSRGEVLLNGANILEMEPNERAKAGLFLCFQYPVEVPGVTVANFLRTAVSAIKGEEVGVWEFQELLLEKMQFMEMDESFAARYLNEGFSGGEKKRNEMLQMLLLNPKFAILDETDSGLDVDALKVVGKAVNSMRGPHFGSLIITHYNRILNHIRPDYVHIMIDGKVVHSGGPELAEQVEQKGYDWVRGQVA